MDKTFWRRSSRARGVIGVFNGSSASRNRRGNSGVLRASLASADTLNWIAASGDFSAGGNWDLGYAPGGGDTASIANSGASTLAIAYSAAPAAVWLGNGASTGGTLTIASGGSLASDALVLGQAGGHGVFFLAGGTLSTSSIAIGNGGIGLLYFDAGILQAAADGQLISGLNGAYLRAGGATIDSNGFTITINQPLLHDPSLDANRDGGLKKIGGGTLTLNSQDTFTGGLTVTAGKLVVSRSNGLANLSNLTIGSAFSPDATVPEAAVDNASAIAPVPEPGTLLLFVAGLCGAAAAACLRGRRARIATL